jgi:hypothetical protein
MTHRRRVFPYPGLGQASLIGLGFTQTHEASIWPQDLTAPGPLLHEPELQPRCLGHHAHGPRRVEDDLDIG